MTQNNRPKNALVWFEVPTMDMQKAKQFYETVLETKLDEREMEGEKIYMFPYDGGEGAGGSLFKSKTPISGGVTIHLPVTDLEAGLERVKKAGGKVTSEPIDIGDGRFAYFTDLDNNSMGLYAHN